MAELQDVRASIRDKEARVQELFAQLRGDVLESEKQLILQELASLQKQLAIMQERLLLAEQQTGRKRRPAEDAEEPTAGEDNQAWKQKEAGGNAAWKRSELPIDKNSKDPSDLPPALAHCFKVPREWLSQLTPVKLLILAKVYLQHFDQDADASALVEAMLQAVQERTGRCCQSATAPSLDNIMDDLRLVGRDDTITGFVTNWLKSWCEASRSSCLNVCCHETGMGKTYLLQMIANPPAYLVDCFVAATKCQKHLWAMMALLCADLLMVNMAGLQPFYDTLEEALGRLWLLASHETCHNVGTTPSVASVMETLANKRHVPYIVGVDDVQALELGLFDKYFSGTASAPLGRVYSLWISLVYILQQPHVFVYAAGRNLGLALIGKQMLDNMPSPTGARVEVLQALTPEGIAAILEHKAPGKLSSLAEKLGLQIDKPQSDPEKQRFDKFVERIHLLTGGIPLFIQRAVMGCLNTGLSWGTDLKEATFDLLLADKYKTQPSVGGDSAAASEVTSNVSPIESAAMKALQKARAATSSDTSILSSLAGPKGLIAAVIMSEVGALGSWKSSRNPALLLFAIFGVEIPIRASTDPDHNDSVAELLEISSCAAQHQETRPGHVTLVLPAAIYANKMHDLVPEVLPVLLNELRRMSDQPTHMVKLWSVLEWVYTDLLQIALIASMRKGQSAGHLLVQDLLPFTAESLVGACILPPPDAELTRPVPGFHVSANSRIAGQLTETEWNDCLKQLQKHPWARHISIKDFGLCIQQQPRLFLNCVGQPKPGSAGPDVLYCAHNVLLLQSAKWRAASKSTLNEKDIAKDISYAVQMYESMVNKPQHVVLVVFNHGQQTEAIQQLSGRQPVPAGTTFGGTSKQVQVPNWLALYITDQQMLEEWLGPELMAVMSQLAETEATNRIPDTQVTKLLTSMRNLTQHAREVRGG